MRVQLLALVIVLTGMIGMAMCVDSPNLFADKSANVSSTWHKGAVYNGNVPSVIYSMDNKSNYLKIDIISSTNSKGDHKWWHNLVNVTGNKKYLWGINYSATVETHAYLYWIDKKKVEHYTPITNNVLPPTGWKHFSIIFTMPSEALKASPYIAINKNGRLEIDPASATLRLAPNNQIYG